MAKNRLSRRRSDRIQDWRTEMAEALQADGAASQCLMEDSLPDTHISGYTSEIRARFLRDYEAAVVLEAANKADGVMLSRSDTHLDTAKLRNAVKVAFWPVSKPIKAVLWAQRHWEDWLWTKLHAAADKYEEARFQKKAKKVYVSPAEQRATGGTTVSTPAASPQRFRRSQAHKMCRCPARRFMGAYRREFYDESPSSYPSPCSQNAEGFDSTLPENVKSAGSKAFQSERNFIFSSARRFAKVTESSDTAPAATDRLESDTELSKVRRLDSLQPCEPMTPSPLLLSKHFMKACEDLTIKPMGKKINQSS